MKKRLIIGAIGAMVIGVLVYFLSQPKEGTAEWHKSRFDQKIRESTGGTFQTMAFRLFNPRGLAALRRTPNHIETPEQLDPDYKALLRLGFLVKNDYAFTNRTVNVDGRWIGQVYKSLPGERAYLSSFGTSNGRLFVIAPRQDIPVWERFIASEDSRNKELAR